MRCACREAPVDTELKGQVALVTGASRGIGAACALALARKGATVALAARSGEALQAQVAAVGPSARAFVVDLSEAGSGAAIVDTVTRELGELSILVNNAGISLSKPIQKMDARDIDAVININVRTSVELCSAAVRSMEKGGRGGAIVNVSSASAVVGTPYLSVYAASKAALDGFTRSLACEVGPLNIRVNSVLPGFIVTDMWTRGRQLPGLSESIEQRIALRRWGAPEDIADVVAFLCSDGARYVTGVSMLVDGGFANMAEVLPRR